MRIRWNSDDVQCAVKNHSVLIWMTSFAFCLDFFWPVHQSIIIIKKNKWYTTLAKHPLIYKRQPTVTILCLFQRVHFTITQQSIFLCGAFRHILSVCTGTEGDCDFRNLSVRPDFLKLWIDNVRVKQWAVWSFPCCRCLSVPCHTGWSSAFGEWADPP